MKVISCNCDKYSYDTRSLAQTAVKGIWDDDKIKMTVYKCPNNNGYHLATANNGKSLRDIPHGLNSIIHSLKKKKRNNK